MSSMISVKTARSHTVRVNHRGDWLFVELIDTDGVTGWGEASHSGNDEKTRDVLTDLCETLTGSDVPETGLPATVRSALTQTIGDKPARTALSAIEQALLDLQARRQNKSVAQLLGATEARDSIDIYTNLNRMCADRSPVTVANAGKQALQGGVNQMKFAPFDEVNVQALAEGGDAKALIEPGRERLAALRDAVGSDVNLMIDCHWRFDPASLNELAAVVREFSIMWIEDPFPTITQALAEQLRDETGAKVTGGEQLLAFEQFEQYLQTSGVDVLIADVKHVGGIGELHRICQLAADRHVAFAPHNPSGPISTAASAHVCVANHNACILEYPFGEVQWRNDFAPAENVWGKQIDVGGPGLGVQLNFVSRQVGKQ